MNWRYFILPNARYIDKYNVWEKITVDDMNNIKTRTWVTIDSFQDMLFNTNITKTLKDWLNELWTFQEEKGQLMIYRTKEWRNIYMYNTIDEIEKYKWNSFKFVDILFESREELLQEKLASYLNFVYRQNLDNIKNLANIATIKNHDEFIRNIWYPDFIQTKLKKKDTILLREIYFLIHKHFFGYAGYTNIYTFLEEDGALIPIRFENSFSEYIVWDEVIEKVWVLLSLQKKKIANLLHEKIENKVLFAPKAFFTKDDLQSFYNKHIWL